MKHTIHKYLVFHFEDDDTAYLVGSFGIIGTRLECECYVKDDEPTNDDFDHKRVAMSVRALFNRLRQIVFIDPSELEKFIGRQANQLRILTRLPKEWLK